MTSTIKRRPTTQDISWLLDLARNKQLDLDPPYQRRSVWTNKDKQFFLDTIFRGYPSPAIFLHKDISPEGQATYHVVDGKQRLQTILAFANDKLRIAKTFGDVRLDGKKWADLEGELELRHRFWNYQLPVEMIDIVEDVVNEVFDRLNRNSRRLTRQELRHAKYDGWFTTIAEAEAETEIWNTLGVATAARAKRMTDTQFISELMLMLLEDAVLGFDQDDLDASYAKYDEFSEAVVGFSEEHFKNNFERVKAYLLDMENEGNVVSGFAKSLAHFYTLWAIVALNYDKLKPANESAQLYKFFMQKVETLAAQKNLDAFLKGQGATFQNAFTYYDYARGASTDLKPREERYKVLSKELLG
jgi:Protein of unknown function DUF262